MKAATARNGEALAESFTKLALTERYMKTFIFVILVLICNINSREQSCELSGTYKVIYQNEAKNRLVTKIVFHDSIFYRSFELGRVKGKILKHVEKNGKCTIYLEDKIEQNVSPIKISKIEKTSDLTSNKMMGNPIWEISEPLTDTIDFKIVYSGQLKVIIEKGKLIKE